MRTPIVGGNWKMNTHLVSARALAGAVAAAGEPLGNQVQTVVFPPFPYLREVAGVLTQSTSTNKSPSAVQLGAQDVWPDPDGAYTGEVSCAMLKDCGVSWVLAGHSERRHVINEQDQLINRKVRAVIEADLSCVLCVGETLNQRDAGQTDSVNEQQLRAGLANLSPEHMHHIVIAYEPVWAIGTGKTATPADAQSAHARIRAVLRAMFGPETASGVRIQYGGSVKAANAVELFGQPDIDGGLIGGASLNAEEFGKILAAARR